MELAIIEAKKAASMGEVPIGSVIVKDGKVLSKAHNLTIKSKNCLKHAEMLAINSAIELIEDKFLLGCDIYTTLEPCYMCAGAILNARISRLYIGAEDERFGAVINGCKIYSANVNHKPDVYSGIMESECSDIMRSFFQKIRC